MGSGVTGVGQGGEGGFLLPAFPSFPFFYMCMPLLWLMYVSLSLFSPVCLAFGMSMLYGLCLCLLCLPEL